MVATSLFRARHGLTAAPLSEVPLLDAADLPGNDDWVLLDLTTGDDTSIDDDRYATLNVAPNFDD